MAIHLPVHIYIYIYIFVNLSSFYFSIYSYFIIKRHDYIHVNYRQVSCYMYVKDHIHGNNFIYFNNYVKWTCLKICALINVLQLENAQYFQLSISQAVLCYEPITCTDPWLFSSWISHKTIKVKIHNLIWTLNVWCGPGMVQFKLLMSS